MRGVVGDDRLLTGGTPGCDRAGHVDQLGGLQAYVVDPLGPADLAALVAAARTLHDANRDG